MPRSEKLKDVFDPGNVFDATNLILIPSVKNHINNISNWPTPWPKVAIVRFTLRRLIHFVYSC